MRQVAGGNTLSIYSYTHSSVIPTCEKSGSMQRYPRVIRTHTHKSVTPTCENRVTCRDTQGLSVHTILLPRLVSPVACRDSLVVIRIQTILLSQPVSQVACGDTRGVIHAHNFGIMTREFDSMRRYFRVIRTHKSIIATRESGSMQRHLLVICALAFHYSKAVKVLLSSRDKQVQ